MHTTPAAPQGVVASSAAGGFFLGLKKEVGFLGLSEGNGAATPCGINAARRFPCPGEVSMAVAQCAGRSALGDLFSLCFFSFGGYVYYSTHTE